MNYLLKVTTRSVFACEGLTYTPIRHHVTGIFQPTDVYMERVPEKKRTYEISKDPEEWKYVKRLLPSLVIPAPPKQDVYPSGWQPQKESAFNRQYFITRSRNHMVPVYLYSEERVGKRRTVIKHIEGNIKLFAADVKAFLETTYAPRVFPMQVNEYTGVVRFRGDYVSAIKYWLLQQGF